MRKAIILLSFGTVGRKIREKSLGKIEEAFKQNFAGYDFFNCFTSNFIMRVLKKRGEEAFSLEERLNILKEKGYDEVLIQSLHIIPGEEYDEKVVKVVEKFKNDFVNIGIGKPLLYFNEDYKYLRENMKAEFDIPEDEAIVFIGHGTEHYSNSIYSCLQLNLSQENDNYYVANIEAYPKIDDIIMKLKCYNKVYVHPFLLVSGSHTKKDIIGDGESPSIVGRLTEEGIESEVIDKGLSEYDFIQKLFLNHLKKELKE